MKHLILLMVFIPIVGFVFGQGGSMPTSKLTIDTPVFFNWPTLEDWPFAAISNNGQFVLYNTHNIPAGTYNLMVQALNSCQKIVLPEVQKAVFTSDSRYVISMHPGDSLCLLTLQDNIKTYLTGIIDFQLFTRTDVEWLVYIVKEPERKLVLMNVRTGAKTTYNNVDSYLLSENGHSLVLQTILGIDGSHSIKWVDLLTNGDREIWKGKHEDNLVLNKDGTQLAFLVQDSSVASKTLWLYRRSQAKAEATTTNGLTTLPENMILEAIQGFSNDGSKLFVQLSPSSQHKKKTSTTVPLNIWSYTDARLQSQQLQELRLNPPCYLAVFDIETSKFRRLQFEDETIADQTDSLLLLTFRRGEFTERYWNQAARGASYLAEVQTGKRTQLPISQPEFSCQRKYVIGYGPEDTWDRDLYVYETAKGTIRNITSKMPIPQYDNEFQVLSDQKSRGLTLAAWLSNEAAVFVYDRYDIWQVDPTGAQLPLNLTNGRKNKWRYRFAKQHIPGGIPTTSYSPLILLGFNEATKQNGFFKLTLGTTKGPELLFAGDYHFESFPGTGTSYLLKARDTNVYLVKRESAAESANIFVTSDFKSFTQLSEIQPEKSVNWLTTELITFNTLDSIPSQAILYKPENFDTTKKYPLIIQYYEKKSDELNLYRKPVVSNGGELDIPWFVSRGYLVLLPDIQYKIGGPGPSALKAVEGAANFMIKRPYVDKQHIGIQGHSFGGYETNYIVAHSSVFAAAVAGSGICNLVSDFGNVWPSDASRQEYWEIGNGRIGTTPWENPGSYVKNSPIFNIGNITTPILMLQNRNDKNVHFEEGLQFFTGLRRAGKRCWMLEYDNGGHGVWGDDYKDYLFRMTQFFDHYLKGAPAPKWMTRGVPASLKGIDSGLDLDTEIATPGRGLLIGQREPPANNTLSGQTDSGEIKK